MTLHLFYDKAEYLALCGVISAKQLNNGRFFYFLSSECSCEKIASPKCGLVSPEPVEYTVSPDYCS